MTKTKGLAAPLVPDAIRVPVEREAARRLRLDPFAQRLLRELPRPDLARTRRELAAQTLLLSEAMAPEVHALLGRVKRVLGVPNAIEVYQGVSFDEAGINAGVIYTAEDPILLLVQGRLLTNLDELGKLVVLGHELGHYLAHGPRWPQSDMARVAYEVRRAVPVEHLGRLASALGMAMELTADRFSLLVGQDLDAVLRVLMVTASGLPASEMSWNERLYLDQCRRLIDETLAAGATAVGVSHPEHNLRAYAAWLFSETEVYAELAGSGPASRKLAEVEETLSRLIRPVLGPTTTVGFGRGRAGGAPPAGRTPAGRRPAGAGPAPAADEAPATVIEGVSDAIGRASRKIGPGLSKLRTATAEGVARVLDRRRPSGGLSRDESDLPDPLDEDERGLLDRFAALERPGRQGADPLADEERDLLDRFAALEREARPAPAAPPRPVDPDEQELLDRLAELERKVNRGD